MGAAAQAVVATPEDETFRALRLRSPGTPAVDNLDEHRDTVAFCDCLAQPSCARHGS